MPLSSLGCSSCALVLSAALTLLLVPAPYLAPGLFGPFEEPLLPAAAATGAPDAIAAPRPFTLERLRAHCPPLDLFAAVVMIVIGFFTYLCEWIQRKLMERRIFKLNQYLVASVERLRAWDAQQEQLDSTLRLVQGAAGEYSLLLYLLLRRRRAAAAPAHDCCFGKDLADDLAFLPPTVQLLCSIYSSDPQWIQPPHTNYATRLTPHPSVALHAGPALPTDFSTFFTQ